ncbi:uncharacterized protein L201_003249 [Kwoniella dendrophila CBS 6074]|uniref:Protein kinase domain-containing protein n=1 Tax=Kwoniella dendrophila CBS 6074 TaxID=1295534 RepID=A0AAX4JTS1_9TREE
MSQEEVEAKIKDYGNVDESLSTAFEEAENKVSQLAINSDIFQALPTIEFGVNIHHAKVPRSTQELIHLEAVKGDRHFVQLLGRSKEDEIVTEKFGISFTDWILQREKTTDEIKLKWATDIAEGLSILHSKNILHKDISTNNILVKGDKAIICDLESRWTIDCAKSPEYVQGSKYDKRADVYGFGTLLWSIERKNMPRPHASLECTGIMKEIMSKCLSNDPARRPTIDEALVELRSLSPLVTRGISIQHWF